ncbi:MAG: biotin--[acetyl-CoA-carboxylase] ligase [Gammaproteobacteria bacterium]|nr:biotin--[acetyl-CoA-carboxylase] ligase [Gammaproteobacteria bacterium]
MNSEQSHKLSKERIESQIASCSADMVPLIHVFEELDSTNQWVLDHLSAGFEQSMLCVAESQIAGRGRAGRSWCSPSGGNVYMSFSHVAMMTRGNVSAISLVVGLAVVRVLSKKGVGGVSLKWPNDILIDGRKLAGILIESKARNSELVLVIGVGINVKVPLDFNISSETGWIDLSTKGVLLSDRNELISLLYIECQKMIDEFSHSGFLVFRSEWMSHDYFAGKEVKIVDREKIIHRGTEMGVDEEGCLLVRSGEEIKRVFSGDVSLRVNNES